MRAVTALALVALAGLATACTPSDWMTACRQGDLSALDRCMTRGVPLEQRDEAGCTCIVVATINQKLPAVQMLVQRGAAIDAPCQSGMTALMLAAQGGALDIAKFLTENGSDMERELQDGTTAITVAARAGNVEVVKFLHKLDGKLDRDWTGTKLMWAAAMGDEDIVKRFLAKGDQLEQRDEHGHTAVFWGARFGKLANLRALAQAGANFAVQAHSGWTPLMAASYYGHTAAVTFMLEGNRFGVDVHRQDKAGWTALMWASLSGNTDIVELLMHYGASIHSTSGWDALMAASAGGHLELVRLLLSRGATWNRTDHAGQMPGDIARRYGHTETAAALDKLKFVRDYHVRKEGRDGVKPIEIPKKHSAEEL